MGKRSLPREQEQLLDLLREVRIDAGIKQADLAAVLGRPQSFVSKYEAGERRLDILELRDVCSALGISLATFARRLEKRLR